MTEMISSSSLISLIMALLAVIALCGILVWFHYREHAATVQRLEADKAELRKDNARLLLALTPALQRFDKSLEVPSPKTAADILKAKHSMSKGERDAKCSCGWVAHSDDPATLQSEIAAHFRENTTAVRGGRQNSWLIAKARAESEADETSAREMAKSDAN